MGTSLFRNECPVYISNMESIKDIQKVKANKIRAIVRERIMKENGQMEESDC